jgi:hypothetical protein
MKTKPQTYKIGQTNENPIKSSTEEQTEGMAKHITR